MQGCADGRRGISRVLGIRRFAVLALVGAVLLSTPGLTPASGAAAEPLVMEQPRLGEPDSPSAAEGQTDPVVPEPEPTTPPTTPDPSESANAGADGESTDAADGAEQGDGADPDPAAPEPTAAPDQPNDPAPEAENDASPDDGLPRGRNGGVASLSPGPDDSRSAQPTLQQAQAMLGAAEAASSRPLIGDDYPAKYKKLPWPYPAGQYIWDEWNFAYRQCTSFVAWRLNSANGVKFSNQYKGLWAWGDAGQWAASAKSVGIKVDKTPAVGAVAWSGPGYGDASNFGHVAWVADVLADGRVVIEEYNAGWAGSYSTRTVQPSAFQGYIHIKDLPHVYADDADGDGIPDSQQMMPWNSDVNGDGLPDAVGFGTNGVHVALNSKSGLGASKLWHAEFGTNSAAGGWNTEQHPRTLVDVNGDGKADVVGFANDGVHVALSTGTGFGPRKRWGTSFGAASGWSVQSHPRTLADVNGDGLPDVVGFASTGVYVSLNTGKGFSAAQKWYDGFHSGSGWSVAATPRWIADMDGDGKADVVGIAKSGVYVARSTGKTFSKAKQWSTDFGGANGWKTASHPRTLADVNGDGRLDVVGFSEAGPRIALNTGSGLGETQSWGSGFGLRDGWKVGYHPRVLADVNGDGRADVVGFANNGVHVALSTGSGVRASRKWTGSYASSSWVNGRYPRSLVDTDGDGKLDLVGFGAAGVYVAKSTGSGFGAAALQTKSLGMNKAAGDWQVAAHPRAMTIQTLSRRPSPTITGTARVGERLTAKNGTWQPKPVALQYQWLRTGKAIQGATSAGYTLTAADLNADVTVRVSASKLGFSGVSHDAAPQKVAKGVLTAAAPRIEGIPKPGTALTAVTGVWGPTPVSFAYQWNRNGAPIPGATGANYTLAKGDVGRRISVTVTGSKTAYTSVTRVAPTFKVTGRPALPLTPPFADVPKTHKFYRQIAWMSTSGLSTGTGKDGKTLYEPRSAVSRQAMAAFLFRLDALKSYRPAAKSPFVDVPTTHRFYREIEWMHSTGLSKGIKKTGGVFYNPKAPVSREAMAAFLFRLEKPREYTALVKSPFGDVPVTHKYYREIAWMYESGLSTGTKQKAGKPKYAPRDPVSRAAMAAFLYRLETGD